MKKSLFATRFRVIYGGLLALAFTSLAQAQPVITSFSPESGIIGSSVVITGDNFDPTTSNNLVLFGATQATVTAASTTTLTVTVPLGANYQYITVTNLMSNGTAYSARPFVVTYTTNGTNDFAPRLDYSSNSKTSLVIPSLGDLDRDGLTDFILPNDMDNTVTLYRNTSVGGSMSFDSSVSLATGTSPREVAIGDFDGDGWPDFAVANYGGTTGTVSVFRNVTASAGSLSFTTLSDMIAGTNPTTIATGDLDMDGKPDLAIGNWNSADVSIFRNTSVSGTVSFASVQSFPTAALVYSVAISDLDGDGKPDIAAVATAGTALSLLRNVSVLGSISMSLVANVASGSAPVHVVVGDLDGDGKPDLVTTNYSSNDISLFRNISVSGTISVTSKQDISFGTSMTSAAIGDINGDGKPDLLLASNAGTILSVLPNNSVSGSFSLSRIDYITGGIPVSVAIGDLNNDGMLDVITANTSTISIFKNIIVPPAPVVISFSPGIGAISTVVTITGQNFDSTPANNLVFFGATQATVTGGSSTTLTVIVPYGTNYQYISVTNLNASLTGYSAIPFGVTYSPLGDNTFRDPVQFTSNGSAFTREVTLTDLNADGKPDLVIANEDNTVSVFPNQITDTVAGVSFGSAVILGTSSGSNRASVSVSDIDGDGKPDIVTVNGGTGVAWVYRNTTTAAGVTPSFAAAITFTTANAPATINVADFDGDGKPDMVVGSTLGSNNVSVLRNRSVSGTISFASFQVLSAGADINSIAVGDFDKDGKPDVAMSGDSGEVSVLQNVSSIGSISLVWFATLTAGTTPRTVVVGDLDGDTWLDIATSTYGLDAVSVFRNTSTTGTISFTAKVDFSTGGGTGPYSLAIGDVDGDGKQDVVTANIANNSMAYLHNISTIGALSFTNTPDLASNSVVSPYSVVLGDMNADGKPDIATVRNVATNNVAVLLQRSGQSLTITSANTLAVDGTLTVTLARSVSPTTLGGSITYSLIAGSGSATINVSGYLTALNAGTVTLTVMVAGDTYYTAATTAQLITIGKATPTLTITSTDTLLVDGTLTATVTTSATLGRGGSITFSISAGSGSATVDSNTGFITAIGAGTVTLMVASPGDADYFLATTSQLITIEKATPTLTITSAAAVLLGGSLTATTSTSVTGGRGGAVTFAISAGSGSATVDANTGLINTVSVGTVTLYATSAGDTDYNGITVSQDISIVQTPPSISSFSPASGIIGSSVTIQGTNFDPTPSNNVVFFGAAQATVTAASTTALTVTVPYGANYQYISVTNLMSNGTAYSARPFIVSYSPMGNNGFRNPVNLTSGGGGTFSSYVTLADMNRDGKPDLVIANNDATLSVFPNQILSVTDTATFGTPIDLGVSGGSAPAAILLGDFDGDGWLDIAAVNTGAGVLSVYRNTTGTLGATPSFASAISFAIAGSPASISMGDLDGDGRPDLAIASSLSTNNLSVLHNASVSGTINFAPAEVFSAGDSPRSVVIGDLDKDGRPDVVVANSVSNDISVFQNISSIGSLGLLAMTTTLAAVGNNPVALALADFDGDALLDIATVNYDTNSIIIYQNASSTGTINFTAGPNLGVGSGPNSIAIGDVDGDGLVDITTANVAGDVVSLVRNASTVGAIAFQGTIDMVGMGTVVAPNSIALGDINADGKPDAVLTRNSNTNNVVVLLQHGLQSLTITSVSTTLAVDEVLHVTVNRSVSPTNLGGGLNYTITSGSGAANVDGNGNVTGVSIGTVTLTITATGDAYYSSATVSQLMTITKATPTLTFTVLSLLVGGTATETVNTSATGGRGGAISFTLIAGGSGSATLDPITGELHAISLGTLTLTATSEGDTDYYPSTRTQQLVILPLPPIITSFSPASGIIGSSVTISGTNFDPTPSNNVVFFGSARAVVTGATSTSLTVSVPLGTDYKYITVTNLSLNATAYSTVPFVVTYTTPSGFSDFAPRVDIPATIVSVLTKIIPAFGDLDQDGLVDVVIPNSIDNTVTVFRNTSTISQYSFATIILNVGVGPQGIALADLDGDGWLDIAVTNANTFGVSSNTISMFHNNTASVGSLSFTNNPNLVGGTNPLALAIGDLDADGKPDLVATSAGGGDVTVFHNESMSGTIHFGSQQSIPTNGSAVYSAVISDLDGDGKPDIAALNLVDGTVAILRNISAPGSLSFTLVDLLTATSISIAVGVGDLDGDGKPDLAVASYVGKNVSLFRNLSVSGSISFTSKQDLDMSTSISSSVNSVSMGDVDGDGKVDLVVAHGDDHIISVLTNASVSGSIGFTRRDYATDVSPASADLVDLDSDGKLDIVTTNMNSFSILRNMVIPPAPVVTSFSPASGAISTVVTITGQDFDPTSANNVVFFGATQAVVTGASSTSLTVVTPYGANYQYISVTNLNTNLTGYSAQPFGVTYTPIGDNTLRPKVALTSGVSASTYQVAIADVNRDGKPDVVVANSDNTVSVFLNQTPSITATASFGSAVTIGASAGAASSSVSVGDLDGDGWMDIAMVNAGANVVSVYRNTTTMIGATPSFSGAFTLTTGSTPLFVSMGDLDLDGRPDLAVINSSSSTLSVFRNQSVSGTIGFSPLQLFSTAGVDLISLAIGDLDKDGKPDIAIANSGSGYVSVLQNKSAIGSLSLVESAVTATLATGTYPHTLVLADIDGDTWLDIAVTNMASDDVSVFLNEAATGTISFTTRIDFSTGIAPNSVAIGDIDGDGLPDMVTANVGDSTVGFYRNTSTIGTPSFAAPTDIASGTVISPYSVIIGDLNADGKPDVVLTTSGTSNNVAVLLQKLNQAITITSANTVVVNTSLSVTLSRSVLPGSSLTYSLAAGSGSATINASGNLTGISLGTVTLTVTAVGDSNYGSVSASQLITIIKPVPTLIFTSATTMTVDGVLTASVSTTASVLITYSIMNNSVGAALVNSSTGLIRAIQVGAVRLIATSVANTTYASASISQVITIQKGSPTLTITSPSIVRVADGSLTVTAATTASYGRGGAIMFSISAGSGSATINPNTGLLTIISGGTLTVTAASAGDADYNPVTKTQLLTIGKSTPTLTFTSANSLAVEGSLTSMVLSTAINGRGGVITYAITSGSGSATVNTSTGLLRAISAGTITLTASSAANTDYYIAGISQLITIGKSTPTLTITSANTVLIDGSLTASAITTAPAGRGGGITFELSGGSGSATINPTTGFIATIGAGTITLIAISAGDTDYNYAAINQVITIGKRTPSLTITSANGISGTNGTLTVTVTSSATASSGGGITYNIVAGSGSATVNSMGLVTGVSAGTITLIATSLGDTNYNAASASQLITIGKSPQILTILSTNTMIVDGSLLASVTSTASNGGAITYRIQNNAIGSATVNSSTGLIRAMQHGTVTLIASTVGNVNYAPAMVSQVIAIGKATPTLTITSANTMLVNGSLTATVNTTATYGRGGAKVYAITAGSGSATVNPSTGLVLAIGSGTVTLVVTTAGGAEYYMGTTSQLITISNGGSMMAPITSNLGVSDPLLIQKFAPEDGAIADDGSEMVEEVRVPKAYSPNGDGFYDLFEIDGILNYPNNELVIINMNGEAVFKAHGYNNDTVMFTGKLSIGVDVPAGTYFYVLTFYDNDKLNTRKGYFELRR